MKQTCAGARLSGELVGARVAKLLVSNLVQAKMPGE